MGIPRNMDMTAEVQEGVGYYQLTQKNYRRSSTSVAYLRPVANRTNLTVRTGAQVLRIVVEKGRAIGVELAGDGVVWGGEVILSLGQLARRDFCNCRRLGLRPGAFGNHEQIYMVLQISPTPG